MAGERDDGIVRLGDLLARAMLDPNAVADAANRGDGRAETDDRLHLVVERMGDAIHSPDRLEHCRLHVPDMLEEIWQGDRAGRVQLREAERRQRDRGLAIASTLDRKAREAAGYVGAAFGIEAA